MSVLHRSRVILCLVAFLSACATPPPPHVTAVEKPIEKPVEKPVFTEVGLASWYGHRHDEHPTASGEPFDLTSLTAAHRTLPFGTMVRVTRLDSGTSATVRINDRGPFGGGRVIDLSAAAAHALNIAGDGTTTVRIDEFLSDQPGGTQSVAEGQPSAPQSH